MFIYNVTIKIVPGIETQWLQWMQTIHMPEVLATKQFFDCALFQLLDPLHDDDGITYIAQYYCNEEEQYHEYINQYSAELRQKGYEKFGDQFIAFRSVLKKVR